MKVLVVDNYDSFTYNIVQYLGLLGAEVDVVRNDAIKSSEVQGRRPDRILISPGPCDPDKAGISLAVIRDYAGRIPILGVCLGHQSIGQAFGGKVIRAKELKHGKTSPVFHDNSGVFAGLPTPFIATRYHSLAVERASLPTELVVTAWTEDGEIMGLQHRTLPVQGVQFHPESVLTTSGMDLLRNFLR
ncbi:MAG TPA: aminodeoxychorismate/anthranilate synthase component II [Labilithrix sp.]|jgi:anthranilate synthase component 2|nr:aminodeoxychorismate/anthranilate synthase component II [Labilithrix sp.]